MLQVTMVLPYYRQPNMLRVQLATWATYPIEVRSTFRLIVVDDGSPEPAADVIHSVPNWDVRLLRILPDIPWNRGGARNLGSQVATTPWLLHLDIDHILPPDQAALLLRTRVDGRTWHRFERYRVGAADDTRRKDDCDPAATFAKIKPHGDSYLCPRSLYWQVGGYDEDYSGCLGGGSPFLKQLEQAAAPTVLPVALHVYTRSVVADASVFTLDRDTSEYSRRRKLKTVRRDTRARNPIRFNWQEIPL